MWEVAGKSVIDLEAAPLLRQDLGGPCRSLSSGCSGFDPGVAITAQSQATPGMSCMPAGILWRVLSIALTPRTAACLPLGPVPAALGDTLPVMPQTSPPSTGTAPATSTAGGTAPLERGAHLTLITVGAAGLLATWQRAGHKLPEVEGSRWWATKGCAPCTCHQATKA